MSSSIGTRRALDLARARRRALPARVDERDLRRPARAPAGRDVSRQRRPDRAARGLRRGEALRRDAHDDVPPAASACRRAIVRIFNTYGPAAAAGRRPGRLELPGPGDRRASRSRSTGGARRPARSATSTTRCAASSRCSTRRSSSRSTSGTRSSSPCSSWRSIVCEVTGVELRTSSIEPLPLGDPTQRRPDITRARELLGVGADGAAARRSRADARLVPGGARPWSHLIAPRRSCASSR